MNADGSGRSCIKDREGSHEEGFGLQQCHIEGKNCIMISCGLICYIHAAELYKSAFCGSILTLCVGSVTTTVALTGSHMY
jgi:hypothetical protein